MGSNGRSFPGIREPKGAPKGVYEINFRLGKGLRRYQRRIKAPSRREARKIRIKLMEEYLSKANNQNVDKLNATFDVLRKQLERDLESDSLRKKTVTRCLNTFDLFFLDFLTSRYPKVKRVNDVHLECVYEYKNCITVDRKRPTGWRSELSTLKGIISRLTRLGYCDKGFKDNLSEIKRPPCTSVPYIQISKEEKAELLEYIKDDKPAYYGITYLLIRLGWRIEETLSIKRANIYLEGKVPVSIRLEATVRKNNKDFTLESIDDDLANVIKQYLADGRSCAWLFPNSRANKIKADHYRNYLIKVSKEVIGKRITPHDFRRSLITEAARDGLSVKDIMAITGHTDMQVLLKHYSFSTEQGRRKVLACTKVLI